MTLLETRNHPRRDVARAEKDEIQVVEQWQELARSGR